MLEMFESIPTIFIVKHESMSAYICVCLIQSLARLHHLCICCSLEPCSPSSLLCLWLLRTDAKGTNFTVSIVGDNPFQWQWAIW